MTIRDYIAAYNKTFEYVEENFGADRLWDLFARISREYCTHLDECCEGRGLDGCMLYWGGETGTLDREKAACVITLENGVFRIAMNECPSVAEVRSRGQEPYYKGEVTYCDHCGALYAPVLAKHGLKWECEVEYNADGTCAGRCMTTIVPVKPV